jgi:hypothetical protein
VGRLKTGQIAADGNGMRRDRRATTSRPALDLDRGRGHLTVGQRTVAIAGDPADNEGILRAYVKLVAEQRGVPVGRAVLLRRRDIAVLSDFLDLDDADLERKLATILDVADAQAVEIGKELRRHRVAVAAMGVGLLAGSALAVGDAAAAPAPTAVSSALSADAMARMDALVESTPAVVVSSPGWPRGRKVSGEEAAGDDLRVEIGTPLVLERSLTG